MSKEYHRNYSQKHYSLNKEYYKNKGVLAKAATRIRAIEFLSEYLKSHPCVDCGLDDILVLQFDHISGKTKNITLNLSVRQIEKELRLCEIRCANCHMKRHLIANESWRIDLGNVAELAYATDLESVPSG